MRRPDVWKYSGRDDEQTNWYCWKRQLVKYVCAHNTEYADVLTDIEGARDAPITLARLTPARVVLAHQMHAFLVALLEGSGQDRAGA